MRRLVVVFSLAILIFAVLCTPAPVGAAAGSAKTIKVTDAREFLEALGSDRIIEMAPGKYNLSEWDPYLRDNDSGPELAPGVTWEWTADGGDLNLNGIENLTIRCAGDSEAEIIIDPRHADVLSFRNCSDITMDGLKFGHSDFGLDDYDDGCEVGVLCLWDSSRITINDAGMYGCGTEGLTMYSVSDMKVANSRIYDCTQGIMTVHDGNNIAFENCVFSSNEISILGFDIYKTEDMSFTNCEFTDNRGSDMFGIRGAAISVYNSAFRGNDVRLPIQDSIDVEFVNCVFEAEADEDEEEMEGEDADSGEAAVKELSPGKIGEFARPGYNRKDETYSYLADPNGKFYHFYEFATDGCSVFCAIEGFEEEFTATSTLPPIKGITYGPENLRNFSADGVAGGSRDDVWCEGVKGYGVGERVNMNIKLRAPFKSQADIICFPELMIVNGHAKTDTTWSNNSRVKTLRLYVGGEPWCDLKLQDTIKPQIFTFGKNKRIYPAKSGKRIPLWDTDSDSVYSTYQTDFSFEIVEVYPGAKYDDTCITGIAFNVFVQAH